MRITLDLLQLAAAIARAGRDPLRWPDVFTRLQSSLQCPTVFAAASEANEFDAPSAADVAAKALDCASNCRALCGSPATAGVVNRRVCLALVEHLLLATGAPGKTLGRPSRVGERFDSLPRPAYVVDRNARLIDINAEGRRILADNACFELADGVFRLQSMVAQGALLGLLNRLAVDAAGEKACLPIGVGKSHRGELWVRRLTRNSDAPEEFLVSFVVRQRQAAPAMSSSLSLRQRELAHHLLSGRTLAESAESMGISRRTAKDHLSALFKLSQTNRQAELVAWLTRQDLI